MKDTTHEEELRILELFNLTGNSVLYSENAWAVVRKSSGGDDMWFPDKGSGIGGSPRTRQLFDWTPDWIEMTPKGTA